MSRGPQVKWKWAAVLCLAAVAAVLLLRSGGEPTPEERVATAIKNLNRQVTWRYKYSARLWEELPDNMQRAFASLTPDYLLEMKQDACRELAYFKPDSPAAIEALKHSLSDPFIQADALKALRAFGPRAERALPRILLLLEANPPETVRHDIYATLASIAPADKRVAAALLNELTSTNENVHIPAVYLHRCAASNSEVVDSLLGLLGENAAQPQQSQFGAYIALWQTVKEAKKQGRLETAKRIESNAKFAELKGRFSSGKSPMHLFPPPVPPP